MLYQVIYSSQSSSPMSLEALEEILVDAHKGNAARGVTGALVYVEGVFLQILEGEKDTVVQLLGSIARDSRHTSVTVFHEGEVQARTFTEWRMAYLSATPEQMATWAGLESTAPLSTILEDMRREPRRSSQVAESILSLLSP